MLLRVGWQRHCVMKSRTREKYEYRTRLTIRIWRHVLYEFCIHAGGEKPRRQQHMYNGHAQHLHCCKNQNCDAHRGRQAQTKNVNGTEGGNVILVFWNTPWPRTANTQTTKLLHKYGSWQIAWFPWAERKRVTACGIEHDHFRWTNQIVNGTLV